MSPDRTDTYLQFLQDWAVWLASYMNEVFSLAARQTSHWHHRVRTFGRFQMSTQKKSAKHALKVALLASALGACASQPLMTVDDLNVLQQAPPGAVIAYGAEPLQFGELTLPDGPGPHPVLVWIHGGCWLSTYDISHSRALAQAFAGEGLAVWNLEYRRVGNPGGGWPGTFMDIANGADYIRTLAKEFPLDLSRVIVGGHSAGGHLALWLAGRDKISSTAEIYIEDPILPNGVLAMAPAVDIHALHKRGTCNGVIENLMGGTPGTVPDRYAAAAPLTMAPLRVPQVVFIGSHDDDWSWLGRAYSERARDADDGQVRLIEARHSAHFEMINPQSSTWNDVKAAVRWLVRQAFES